MEKIGRQEVIKRLHCLYAGMDENKSRIRILQILNQIQDKSHYEEIENYFLSDEDPNVRMEAAKLLAFNYDHKKAINPLIWVFENEKVEEVKYTALRLLVALGQNKKEFLPRVVQTLKTSLKSDNDRMIMEASESLGILKEQSSVDDLIELLKSKNKQVRIRAIRALDGLCNEQAVIHLLKTLGTPSLDIWNLSFNALKHIRRENLVDDLILNLEEKAVQVDVFEEGYIRKGIAKALGSLGDARAIRHLISLLDDKFYWVKWEAIEALDKIDPDWRKKYKSILGNKKLTISK